MNPARGLYFEDFEEGFSIESPGRTITEADIVNFAALSGDWNPIHVDAEYCKTSQFGQRVAHGLLVLSVASGLAMQMGFMAETVKAFIGIEWKFRAPVYIGDTVRVQVKVARKRAMRALGGGMVFFNVEIVKQDGKTAQKGEWQLLAASRPAD